MLSMYRPMPIDQYLFLFNALLLVFSTAQCQKTSFIQYEYFSSSSNYSFVQRDNQTDGIIPTLSSLTPIYRGRAFVLIDANGRYDGCQPSTKPPNFRDGVALIQRGGDCTFYAKIMRAKQYNASAVLIYDPNGQNRVTMWNNQSDILSMYISSSLGSYFFDLILDPQSRLNISIDPIRGSSDDDDGSTWYGSRSATIFIAVAISVLVSLCVLWFSFYYCQRYRARTAKDRLQTRLTNAAKKALAKMTLITVTDETSFDEPCVICLDNIKTGDTVRQLVCHHTFHQTCVDPWLLTHRHCPLCNLDILNAYHITIPGRARRCSIAPAMNSNSIVMTDRSLSPYPRLPTISATIEDDGERIRALHSEQQQQEPVSYSPV